MPGQLLTGRLEQPGWRGYALPKLHQRYTALRSSSILGVLWALWHLPQTLASYTSPSATLVEPRFLAVMEIQSAARILGCTFVFTWVYNNTESVSLMILLHSWSNTVHTYAASTFPYFLVPVTQHVLPCCIVALFLVMRALRGERLSDKSAD